MDDEYSDAKNRALVEIRHTSTFLGNIDHSMMLESLPSTIK